MAARKCNEVGCDKEAHCRGFCKRHYEQRRTSGRITPLPRLTAEQRFHKNYEICPQTGCWLWTGTMFSAGYGSFTDENGRTVRAHRYSYELHKGEIPDGQIVRHKCDVPRCVGPDCLELGTHAQNSQDKVDRDRQAKGSANGSSKLTEEQALEIYHAEGTLKQLGERYGVDQSLISMIKLKKIWKHIHDEFR